MLWFKRILICCFIFLGFYSLKSAQSSAFPEFLQSDFSSLFVQYPETFDRLQVFAQNLASREQRVITSKNLETFLSAKDLKTFARYLSSEQFAKRLEKIQEKNPILVALAKKWIRNAALRVFADPLRSFIEPIANACDATAGKDKSIGKFGLGFFSILSFLSHQETDGAIINIKTACRSDFEQGKLFAYSMTFEKTGSDISVWDDLTVKFNQLKNEDLTQFLHELKPSFNTESDMPTGTIVSIIPKNKQSNFSNATLNALKNYVGYMTNYCWVPIYLNDDIEPVNKCALSLESMIGFPINVFVLPKELKVVDRGFGISIPVALSNLLIPSSSTKPKIKVQTVDQKEPLAACFVSLPYKKDVTESHFLITVNGSVVVDRVISTQIKNENGRIIDFKIELPQSTQLTTARDEILISENGKSFEEAYLKNVITKTIVDVINCKISSNHLIALYNGLLAWETQSAARYIKGRFTGYFKKSLQEQLRKSEQAIAVPIANFEQLKKITEYFAGTKKSSFSLLPVDGVLVNHDFSKFEKTLVELASSKVSQFDEATEALIRNALNFQLIHGMRVFFVPENILDKISTLGMQTLLFVTENELADLTNVAENVVAKCVELDLASFDKKASMNTTLLISTFSDSLVFAAGQTVDVGEIVGKNLAQQFLKDHRFLLQSKNGQLDGILTDKFILSLFGTMLLPSYDDAEKYLNFVLTSMLSRFGINGKNMNSGQLYFSDTLGHFEQLWPLTSVSAENIARLFVAIIWYQVNNTELVFSDNIDSMMHAKDYFLRLCYRGISTWFGEKLHLSYESVLGQVWHPDLKERYNPIIQPFNLFGFDLRLNEDNLLKLVNITLPVFIGRYGASQMALQSEVQELIQFIAPAANYDQTLKFSCNNFNLVNAFTHLFLVKNASKKIIKNKDLQMQVLSLIDALSGFYLQYCNIPENEFHKVYGHSGKINVINPTPQVDVGMILEMLNSLCIRPPVFERVLQLQIDDFARQTNIELRSAQLVQKQLYLPLITSNTVLSILAKFFYSLSEVNADRRLAIICQIIDLAQEAQDLVFVLQILMIDNNLSLIKDRVNKQTDSQFLSFIVQIKDLVQRYIHEKVDVFTISDFYEKCRDENFVTFDSRLKALADSPIARLVYEYLKCTLFDSKTFERQGYLAELEALTKNRKPFTLRKLMRAHFTGEGLSAELLRNDLKSVLKKVHKVKTPVDSWKITQAVEAGSQRDAAEAASVECLQNSVDAIKGFFRKLKDDSDQNIVQNFALRPDKSEDLCSIKFYLSLVSGSAVDTAQVLFEEKDPIGMYSMETVLADLVLPDYSRKTPAQGNIGDMGNGTFKIFQDSKFVVVTTRLISDPNKIFVLHITPHRNDEGLVDDLDLICVQHKVDGQWQNFWGTKFEILFNEKKRSDALVSLVAAKDFLKNCVGSTNVLIDEQQKNIKVYFKNELLNNFSEHDLLYQHKMHEKILFKVYKRENSSLPSYLTTGGVPFRPLSPVAHEMALLPQNFISGINSGLIINFELGTYQPVQSRTRLNISHEIKQSLNECLLEVFYIYTLEQHQNDLNFLGSIFTHLNSKLSDFAQLRLDKCEVANYLDHKILDKRDFFCNYQSLVAKKNLSQQQKNFFDFINKEYKNGLVQNIESMQARYQSIVNKAFADVGLTDVGYESFCENQKEQLATELNKLFSEWKSQILCAEYAPSALIHGVVVPWFESKIGQVHLKLKKRGEEKKSLEIVAKHKNQFSRISLKDLNSVLNDVLTAYSISYFKLNKLKDKAPKIALEHCSEGVLGYYLKQSNKIVISPIKPMLITNILKMAQALVEGQYQNVKNNAAHDILFGIRRGVDCGVIVHELLHAATQTIDSYHTADFEDRAKQQVIDIVSELYTEWSNQFIQLSGKNKTAILEIINKNIQNIEKIEQEDKAALLNILT
ncbi:MAG: hypothetical protein US49_C0012G0015 [candidate division TM6 bacterium GW2011_GWF2_37_49]|nr:MAG: hypothetical protein US49_C0012G0015 [candidate division TM6 bacterium GW2011_GWF2_37_49]